MFACFHLLRIFLLFYIHNTLILVFTALLLLQESIDQLRLCCGWTVYRDRRTRVSVDKSMVTPSYQLSWDRRRSCETNPLNNISCINSCSYFIVINKTKLFSIE